MEHATGFFDQGSSSTNQIPDEIDGDDRLGVGRRTGVSSNSKLVSNAEEPTYGLDESMFIENDDEEGDGEKDRLRRYSVIGNDPSFK